MNRTFRDTKPGTVPTTPTRLTFWQRLCERIDSLAALTSPLSVPPMPLYFTPSPHYEREALLRPMTTTDPLALLDAALAAAHDAGRESMHPGRRVFQEQADAKAAEARAAVIAALGLQARRSSALGEFLAAERCDLAR